MGVRLGITYSWQPVGQPLLQGVYVTRIEPGGVGERAGLQVQDHIVKFDGRDVDYGSDLLDMLATKKPGDTVSMVVIRSGNETPLVAQF